jgi:hemolysin activation/secretion protein
MTGRGSHGLIVRLFWVQPCLLAVAAALHALPQAARAADDTQRLEERLPTVTKPSDEAAPAPVLVPATQAELASFPEFTLRAVDIEGVTAFPKADALACTEDLPGKTVGAIEIVELTQCITRLYRERGFFLSRAVVPPQEVMDGTLKVRAIEGYIAAVTPTGISQADADGQFANALSERPGRLATFERALLLLADRAGHRVTASQLAPDPNDPARFTLVLGVEVSHVAWRFYGDNRGTEPHGPEQVLGSVAFNALLADGDRLAFQVFTAPTDTAELIFGDLNYARSWVAGAFWTEFGASASRSRDGNGPPILAPVSETERIYGRITVPVLRTRAQSLWTHLAVDARSTELYDPLGPDADEATRAVRASANYTLVLGDTRGDAMIELAHGLDVFGASENGDAALTRADGRPQFTRVRLDASVQHKFSDRWEFVVMAAGQLADGALVAAEEFGGGGARFGRAYDYSEIVGDDGIAGAAELRWGWRNAFDAAVAHLQLYAYVDAVRIWNIGADPFQLDDASLSSAGGGIRITPIAGILASLEVAKPWSRDVTAEGDRSPRIFVSLSVGW